MHIRPSTADDEGACRALFGELVETHRRLYPDALIGSDFVLEGDVVVAELDGRVVGYAGLLWHGRVAELEPIVVSARCRGRGVGRALAEHAVAAARDLGAVRVTVRPVGRNVDAIAFFHSVGFDVLGRLDLQYELEPRERHVGETIAGRAFRV